MSEVRHIEKSELRLAAAVLARAFDDSPVYAAVLAGRSADGRARALHRVKLGFVRAMADNGHCRVLVDERVIRGVTLVTPPRGYPLSLRRELLQATGCATTGPLSVLRFLNLTAYMRKRHLAEPHFYLFAIGVDPGSQGRGFGKQLLADLHARADAAEMPCYLETEKAINVRLYESVGYRVVTDERIPRLFIAREPLGVRMWTMVRPAQSVG